MRDFVKTVKQQMEKLGVTHAKLADATGLSRQYIYKVLNGQNVTLETAQLIADALQIDIEITSQ